MKPNLIINPSGFYIIVRPNKNGELIWKTRQGYKFYATKLAEESLIEGKRSDKNGYAAGKLTSKQIDIVYHNFFEVDQELMFNVITNQIKHNAFKKDANGEIILNMKTLGKIVRFPTEAYKYKDKICNSIRTFVCAGDDLDLRYAMVEKYFIKPHKIKSNGKRR